MPDFTAAGYHRPYYLRNKDSNRVLPNSIRYLTSGLVSIMGLIGITAAIMSSADSSMLSASSMVTKNVYQSFIRPMLICVLYFEKSNTYGSLLAFSVGVVFRWMCGEPIMNVPVTLRLPLYDEEHGQVFPFRLTCMLIGLITQLLGSYCAFLAFRSGWIPQRLDVFHCFAVAKSKPTDQSCTHVPPHHELSGRNDASPNETAPRGHKTSAVNASSKPRKTSSSDASSNATRTSAEAKKSRKTIGEGGSSKLSRKESTQSQKDTETEDATRRAPEPTTAKSDLPANTKKSESKLEARRSSDSSKASLKKQNRSISRVQIDWGAERRP